MHHHHDARSSRGARSRSSLAGGVMLAAVLALSACRGSGRTDEPTAGAAEGTDATIGSETPDPSVAWQRAGAGHTSNIDMVAIAPDGTAVLTRDQIGGTRLWPVLDGSVEAFPLAVEIGRCSASVKKLIANCQRGEEHQARAASCTKR